MQLEDVDRAILRELQRDARLSMRELAARVGVSTPTASAKVRSLAELGVIRGYRVVLDPRVLGRSGHLVEVETRPALARALADRLGALDGVEEVIETAGGRIFLRYLSDGHASTQALMAKLAEMEDVTTYRLHPVVAERAGQTSVVEDTRQLAVLCHFCGGPIHGVGIKKRWEEDGGREHRFCCRNCATSFGERLQGLAKGSGKGAKAAKGPHRH